MTIEINVDLTSDSVSSLYMWWRKLL